jgi:hypothetical protein
MWSHSCPFVSHLVQSGIGTVLNCETNPGNPCVSNTSIQVEREKRAWAGVAVVGLVGIAQLLRFGF